eukprot:s1128_g10.t1
MVQGILGLLAVQIPSTLDRRMIHHGTLLVSSLDVTSYFARVPTASNIADGPSCLDHSLCLRIGAMQTFISEALLCGVKMWGEDGRQEERHPDYSSIEDAGQKMVCTFSAVSCAFSACPIFWRSMFSFGESFVLFCLLATFHLNRLSCGRRRGERWFSLALIA